MTLAAHLVALLLAADALILHCQDQLLGDGVELGDLFGAQAGDDVLGGLIVGCNALLGKLTAKIGQLHRVGARLMT